MGDVPFLLGNSMVLEWSLLFSRSGAVIKGLLTEKSKILPPFKESFVEKLKITPIATCEAVWDNKKERFRRRYAFWKRQYISKGGRLTLT